MIVARHGKALQRTMPRGIARREGVGAAGRTIQRSCLSSLRMTIQEATLILVEEGTKQVSLGGHSIIVREGEAVALDSGAVVDITGIPGPGGCHRALWLGWSHGLLADSPALPKDLGPRVVPLRAIDIEFRLTLIRALESLGNETLPSVIVSSRLREVLLWLETRDFRFRASKCASFAGQVRHILSTDLAADWSLLEVARRTATSVATARRRLAAEGHGFRYLLQDVRMSHALALLQNTDARILDIALAVGYESASRFSVRFRSRFGFVPSDVRRERHVPVFSQRGG